ncbi:porin family protein [Pontibacter silvestris]|uniref:Porin family protein n=1 Tax=Pontibacter silvestris TaxID=2305183 RepID=A0ABW4X017_9BACT|nr:porin family protein [Pontibacter silvestris]MCC9135549.1 PorT family protein [Pontibacter silvestris]
MLLLFGGNSAIAQKKIYTQNKPGYDEKRVHYGFYLALPLTKYNVTQSQEYANQLSPNLDTAMTVNAKVSPGFYTGLVLNVRLADNLDARFVPGVGFYVRTIEYGNMKQDNGEWLDENKSINSTMVEMPLLLKYKSKRRTNYRMYFVAGIKPAIDLGNNRSDETDEDALVVNNLDLALEYGVGLDIFYPYFKFAPELRFSHGIINQHKPNNSIYNNSIQKLTNHNVSLILFFE